MASEFKKGDKVKLKSGVKEHANYGGMYFWNYMKFKTGTVRSIMDLAMVTVITIEENPYSYSTEMVEKI